jgi:hypothetical protein
MANLDNYSNKILFSRVQNMWKSFYPRPFFYEGLSTFGGMNTLTNDQNDSVTEKGDSRIVQ